MNLLRHKQDIRTLGFVLSFFLCVWTLWSVELPLWAIVPVYAWALLMAMVAAVINHNALHSPTFKKKWLNRTLHIVLGFIYGMPVSLFVPVHNLSHHKHTQTPRDVMRSSKLRSKWNLLNVLRSPSVMGIDTLKDDYKYFKVQKRKGAAIYRHLRLETIALFLYAATLLVLDWKNFLWLVFIPWQVSQGFIVGINFVQHDGCEPDNSGYNHSRNFVGKPFNWVFLNNGFHTMHHRVPGMHWSALREAHDTQIKPHIDPALDIPNAATFFVDYLLLPGTRRTYKGQPHAPEAPGPDQAWFYDTDETYSTT